MFTGIIEALGRVERKEEEGRNIHYTISSQLSDELKIDQSVAHDGVCLTVVETKPGRHKVTAINETLQKTALSEWEEGREVNLERCMPMNGRFDGHIVQGHVDTVGICEKILEEAGSWRFYFTHPARSEFITVPKGSITINGVSLTVVDSSETGFSVAIIPYTFEHSNFHHFKKGTKVNLEFDVIGKYVQALLHRQDLKPS